MATIYIEEYQHMKEDGKGNIIGPGVLVAAHKVAIGVASAQSAVFNDKTRFLIVESDTVCQFEIGINPTANGNSQYLSANNRKLIALPANTNGSEQRLAVIDQQ